MRILVLTHGRSGGLSISRWIQNELRYKLHHEPFIQYDNDFLDNVILKEDNVVIKDFPFNLTLKGYDVYKFIKTFDKVILHKRLNLRDLAISLVNGWHRNKKDENKISHWHEKYELNEEWIENNIHLIKNEEKDILKRDNLLYQIYDNNDIQGLRTTYENIFENKDDIIKIVQYLGIQKPEWLDILDSRHKLRNGDLGMNDYKKGSHNIGKRNLL